MNELDKWAADRCGVEIEDAAPPHELWFRRGSNLSNGRWTIDDANDREIVRQHFGIATFPIPDGPEWYSRDINGNFNTGFYGSIKESEIACIKAIKENET